jgi:tetratricopeptide (TPR) repeat protein
VTEGKLTKEELREDPVVDALMRTVSVVRQRTTTIAIVVGIIVVGIVAAQLVRQSGAKAEKEASLLVLEGEGQYASGNTPEALRQFLTASDKFGGSPSGKIAGLRAADCQLEIGQTGEAQRLYQKFLDTNPRDGLLRASALRGIAKALESSGQGGEAAKKYLEAAEIAVSPMRADDLISAAQLHLQAGQLTEAKALYERALEQFPGSPRARDAKDGLDRVKARSGS